MEVNFYCRYTISFLNINHILRPHGTHCYFPNSFQGGLQLTNSLQQILAIEIQPQKMSGIEGMFTVLCCFDKHNLFLHCRRESKEDSPKMNCCLSQLLSNVKNRKGKINSPPAPEKEQQDEINWEGNHCPIHTSTGTEMNAYSRVHLKPHSQGGTVSLAPLKMFICIVCYKAFQFSWGDGSG